ncbi:hypothetical protein BDQ17DRAFT_1347275 [Cyathus striatus]|nr:hypothetical protein BDQ17DRAFT_1347275 [Cyathus striatus]
MATYNSAATEYQVPCGTGIASISAVPVMGAEYGQDGSSTLSTGVISTALSGMGSSLQVSNDMSSGTSICTGMSDPLSNSGLRYSNKRHRSIEDDMILYARQYSTANGCNDDRGHPNKKQRIFLKDMPWYAEQVEEECKLHPDVLKTRNTLRLFANDPDTVKRWAMESARLAVYFPECEWDNIIRGRPVNLSHVLSGINATTPFYFQTLQVGDTKFTIRPSNFKEILCYDEWFPAWLYASSAIKHAFPHRSDELTAYGEYIRLYFMNISEPIQVVRFDEAVRTYVASRSDIRLCDFQHFHFMETAFLTREGAEWKPDQNNELKSTSRSNAIGREKSKEVCRKFNSAAGCNYHKDRCRYRHKCFKCNKQGHGMADCKML